MHEIDLKNYSVHTDLLVDIYDKNKENEKVIHNEQKYDEILVEETEILEDNQISGKKKGLYRTITFQDVTDKDNFNKVENVLIKVLKEIYNKMNITEEDSCLIVGLGNEKSTPDSLGPLVVDHTLVTKYLFNLGEVENGYRNTASFKPNVTGVTGIETGDLIKSVVNTVKPKFIIVIDALASSSVSRLNKTIQITDTGISPGSGIGNNRDEISKKSLGIPVIAIGIPTVVDAVTIVNDTFQYMLKQFSYKIDNINNKKLKFVSENNQNYLDHNKELTKTEKEQLLGMIGSLEENEFKNLIYEVLSPIDYNLMVTPKEVDFMIEKLALLISSSLNKSLHEAYKSTI